MISVAYITNREPRCLLDRRESQWDLLVSCLKAQTFTDWELIVVNGWLASPLEPPELQALPRERVLCVRPKPTPWGGWFCAASARNTALAFAAGRVTFGLDDCTEFDRHLLAQIDYHAQMGEYLVPAYRVGEHLLNPNEVGVLKRAGGILAYPTELAKAAGGYDENFDGTNSLEDWEFSERLIRHGVRFVKVPGIEVELLRHHGHAAKQPKCHRLVKHLCGTQTIANERWFDVLGPCHLKDGRRCQVTSGICDWLTR